MKLFVVNVKFDGMWTDDMARAGTKQAVQSVPLYVFSNNCILIYVLKQG